MLALIFRVSDVVFPSRSLSHSFLFALWGQQNQSCIPLSCGLVKRWVYCVYDDMSLYCRYISNLWENSIDLWRNSFCARAFFCCRFFLRFCFEHRSRRFDYIEDTLNNFAQWWGAMKQQRAKEKTFHNSAAVGSALLFPRRDLCFLQGMCHSVGSTWFWWDLLNCIYIYFSVFHSSFSPNSFARKKLSNYHHHTFRFGPEKQRN
jgi:hypothetical protein